MIDNTELKRNQDIVKKTGGEIVIWDDAIFRFNESGRLEWSDNWAKVWDATKVLGWVIKHNGPQGMFRTASFHLSE